MPPILIEAAIDSIEAAERAVREGAHRLEVCADLDVGGLTPSAELLTACRTLGVPCMAMARPRAGDFVYDAADLDRLNSMVKAMCDAGAEGVVFGVLTPDRTIHADAVHALVAECAGKESVFHRAFDDAPDALQALDTLIACGVTRVLTAGHAATAAQGAATLAALVAHSAQRVQVLPGGAVRAANVAALVQRTGVTQVHARATAPRVIAEIRMALDAARR
jgi:copper homeostasis protein